MAKARPIWRYWLVRGTKRKIANKIKNITRFVSGPASETIP